MDKEVIPPKDDAETDQEISLKELIHLECPKWKFPHIGMRAIKTTITVAVILVLYHRLNRDSVILALSAGVIAMQSTIESSVRNGFARLMGTAIGGFMAIILSAVILLSPYTSSVPFNDLMICIGTLLLLVICIWLHMTDAIIICLVVFFFIMIDTGFDTLSSMFSYAVSRMIDTGIGILIAVVINQMIRPPKIKENEEDNEKNKKGS